MKRASEPLLASPLLQPDEKPPTGGYDVLGKSDGSSECCESELTLSTEGESIADSSSEYVQLQRRIFRTAFFVTAFAVAITALFFDLQASISLLLGGLSGILYLRLLARSIGKLGNSSKSVSKIQLLVPVVLVLAVSKLSQLELLPALLGFVLYKPSLIFQTLLDSRSRA